MSSIDGVLHHSHPGARLVSTVTARHIAAPSQYLSNVTSSVEYPPHSTSCSLPRRQAIIEKLSDKVLLNVFCYFLDASPRHWPTLMHICRKWRRIVFASQRALQLRLFCTHRTPVPKTLDVWPTLPIVVQFGGSPALDPPATETEDKVMAVLNHSDRITSISLTVTSSLLEKLSAIERPFSALEDLVLLSRNGTRLTLPSTLKWGPRLRYLNTTRVTFPSLLQLLDSSKNLVDLRLHQVLDPSRFSPAAVTTALSGMVQLQSLSLHFLSTGNDLTPPPPFGELVVLPALTRFNFRGGTEYLEHLVARIDTPLLRDIEVTFFDRSNFDLSSKFRNFTDRIGMHKSYRRADILCCKRAISIFLTLPGDPSCLTFHLFCKKLSEQLFFVTRFCFHFSASLFNVEDLRISAKRPLRPEAGLYSEQWWELLNSFTGVKWFLVSGNLSADIVCSSQVIPDGMPDIVLPALQKLYVLQPEPRYSPLRDAVVSFMTSRRLSGHPVTVEYERLRHIGGTGLFPQHDETLCDDTLLNIFRHCLDATPQFWPTLGFVCQRWRQIILSSPLGLNLRLHCTHGTPVSKALNCWPTLPIVILYGGVSSLDPPAAEDVDNIIAALKQSARVISISLTVTSSIVERLSTVSEPFSELEELALWSQDTMELTLPGTFRWGPRLRTLHSTGIAFPSFPQLLLPSQDLVDLRLHEIPRVGYFPPETFANALANMTHLQTLALHFHSFPSRRSYLSLPPPTGERIVLPALTRLKYRGISKYLDCLVARIDAPTLGDIDITFFSQPTMDASQIGRFIERTEIRMSLIRAVVQTSAHAISIFFPNSSTSTPLQLQISCKQFDWQVFCMAQVCDHFSPFLSRVQELSINTTESSSGWGDLGSEQWPELIRSFGGTRDIWVADELKTDILRALGQVDGEANVLPALRHLRVETMEPEDPSWDDLLLFLKSRTLSGRPIQVANVPLSQCHICGASFRQNEGFDRHLVDEHSYCRICDASFKPNEGLDRHLVDKHSYQMVCTYCANFVWIPGHRDLFRKHLKIKHRRATHKNAVNSGSPLPGSRHPHLESVLMQHITLRAPNIVAPNTTATAPPSQ